MKAKFSWYFMSLSNETYLISFHYSSEVSPGLNADFLSWESIVLLEQQNCTIKKGPHYSDNSRKSMCVTLDGRDRMAEM